MSFLEGGVAFVKLALFTAIYPAVERFLPAWSASVTAQTDRDFDLWIANDGMDRAVADARIGHGVKKSWIPLRAGSSVAHVRQQAIEFLIDKYDGIVFVDSDDLLAPARIEAARKFLAVSDVNACAMRLVDEEGRDGGATFNPHECESRLPSALSHVNVFGLSNTAYRSGLLSRLLPIPASCALVDWYLATKAWNENAVTTLDPAVRMAYRQYGANTAPVMPPFTVPGLLTAGDRVLHHYDLLLAEKETLQPAIAAALFAAQAKALEFRETLGQSEGIASRYVEAVNRLQPVYFWWEQIANPALEHLWKR
jgi:glycosyltransferase involved in cell wall biosynthesis